MKSYLINSIDIKFCSKTTSESLSYILFYLCEICKKIPIPFYKSIQNKVKYYCKTCFEKENKNNNLNMFEPSKTELGLYDSLLMSCKNFESGCDKLFTIHEISAKLGHEKRCGLDSDTLNRASENESVYEEEYLTFI